MNAALWIAQILLAVAYLAAGAMKLARPKKTLEAALPWTANFSAPMIRFIGSVEILGALGLVLPATTGIATVLTPVAAVGLATLQLGAILTHARRREPRSILVNVILLTTAGFIAWGRFGPYAF